MSNCHPQFLEVRNSTKLAKPIKHLGNKIARRRHPDINDAGKDFLLTNNFVICGNCSKLLSTSKTKQVSIGDLPPVHIHFKIKETDIEDFVFKGFPDETYSNSNLTLFKHGNTIKITNHNDNKISLSDLAPLLMALLKHHEGDEMTQLHFLDIFGKLKIRVM